MRKLNYICFGNNTGYSQAAQDLLIGLDDTGRYDIRVEFMFGSNIPKTGMTRDRQRRLEKLSKKPRSDDRITLFHTLPTMQRTLQRTSRSIGFATFETFQPIPAWIKILNRNDAIITPSRFNYRIFAHESINKPIFYIPHCYDTELYNSRTDPLNHYDRFSFLFLGTWKVRKGYQELIEAWLKEFRLEDNVQLIIKTDKVAEAKRYVEKAIGNSEVSEKEMAPILFEENIFDELTLPRFIKSFDCYISSTLGEGFGLPGLQAMALGVPVVITNFSGCQDYAKPDTATLLEPSGFQLKSMMDKLPQYKNKKWAFISVKTIRKAMRHVLNNPEDIKRKASVGSDFVKMNFATRNAVAAFDEMMETVFDG